MNAWGITILSIAAQVSLLCAVGGVLYFVARRRNPAGGVWTLTAVLALVVGYSLLAPLDLPVATSLRGAWQSAGQWLLPASGSAELPATAPATPSAAQPASQNSAVDPAVRAANWQQFMASFQAALAAEQQARQWRWPAWLAVALFCGIALGLARIAAALLAVRTCAHRARPLEDPAADAILADLRRQLGCRAPILLREAHTAGSPYTLGWPRAHIVLPADWRTWTSAELRSVLAHEVAHVHRGDFAWGLVAQLGLALHFYNPLVHWLVGRLRLEQEIAADAWGARLGGGRQHYLVTLAQMALRPSAVPLAARPFLPPARTLMRRVEMLRDPSNDHARTFSNRSRLAVAGVLLLAAALFSQLPGPRPRLAIAAPPADPQPTLSIDFQAEFQGEDDAQRTARLRQESTNKLKDIGLALNFYHGAHKRFPAAVEMGPDGKTPHSWRVAILPHLDEQLYQRYRLNEPWDSDHNKQLIADGAKYFSVPGANDAESCGYFVLVGPGSTFHPADKPTTIRGILDGTSKTIGVVEAKRSIPWTKPQDIEYTDDQPLPKLGGYFPGGYNAAGLDSAVHFLPDDLDEKVLRALITKSGREVLERTDQGWRVRQ